MTTRAHFLQLSLAGALLTACTSEPLSVYTDPQDRSLQRAFGVATASQPVGPVTIRTMIDFSTFPFHGTFDVIQGSAELGCSDGTFVDHPANPARFISASVRKVFTCESGSRTGAFTANFNPGPSPGPGDANGHWNILEGSGDFANLRGAGDFSVVFSTTGPAGVETLTGTIHFDR